jgi:hypothetical protein
MWWLPNLEVAKELNLMTALGTRRTRGPQEMPVLAMNVARNQAVEVIGVSTGSVEAFQGMTAEQLFGKGLTNGSLAEAVREPPGPDKGKGGRPSFWRRLLGGGKGR